jgi:hypothetical protein
LLARDDGKIWVNFKLDRLAKNLKMSFPVIPAEAGIRYFQEFITALDSGFTGVATFCGFIKIELKNGPKRG